MKWSYTRCLKRSHVGQLGAGTGTCVHVSWLRFLKKWWSDQFLFWCSELRDTVEHTKDTICKTNWARWICGLIFTTPLPVLFSSDGTDSTPDERPINGFQCTQIEMIGPDTKCNLQLWCFSGLSAHLGFPVPFAHPNLQILFWGINNKDMSFKHDFPIYHGLSSLSLPTSYKISDNSKNLSTHCSTLSPTPHFVRFSEGSLVT